MIYKMGTWGKDCSRTWFRDLPLEVIWVLRHSWLCFTGLWFREVWLFFLLFARIMSNKDVLHRQSREHSLCGPAVQLNVCSKKSLWVFLSYTSQTDLSGHQRSGVTIYFAILNLSIDNRSNIKARMDVTSWISSLICQYSGYWNFQSFAIQRVSPFILEPDEH